MGWLRRREVTVRELGLDEFETLFDDAFTIFIDAMGYPRSYRANRILLARTHLRYPDLRAVGAFDQQRLVGFAYGYRTRRGQWWAGEVERALRHPDSDRSRPWLHDAFELCEIHVTPAEQGRGLGRTMLRQLIDMQPCERVLLSTPSGPTPAARLYADEGFTTLASGFHFSGDSRAFEIMGKQLDPVDAR